VRRSSLLLAAFTLAAAPLAAQGAPAWGPPPPFLPKGAEFAVMQGDPSKAAVYTLRLKLPDGYVIAPHFHPTDEHVTVISGNFLVGMGDAIDKTKVQHLAAGGFITAPANAHHYAIAQGPTVVQVHGMGPFAITYVKASDDPRNAKATP
jgi:quercetin dioxygenase-like cupin family protein